MDRVLRFLLSRRSFVGFAAAGAGLLLHLLGVLTGPLWLSIVVGLYVLGVLLVPKEHGPDIQLDPAADRESIRDGLDELVRRVQFKVAADILARVESIRKAILALLDGSPELDVADPTVYLIRQTALDYLPSALSAYLALPRIYAERRAVVGGRTPHDVLLEQLDLMDASMREAEDAMRAHDSERLLENGRFLADRFGRSSLRLDAPQGTGPQAAAATTTPEPIASTPDAEAEARSQAPASVAAERERVP